MESVTTMLLTFLFVPKFKKKFAKALVRHYDAVARFPETLPWPGVLYRRDDSDYGDVSRSDGDGRAPSRTRRLEFPEAAYVAASPTIQLNRSNPSDAAAASEAPDRLGDEAAEQIFGSERHSLSGASRALTAYASRRTTVCRCLDRVTVQLFGAAPVVAVDSMRDALLFATAKTLERCVVGRHPPKTSSRFEREEAFTEETRFDFSISRFSEDDENDVLNRSSRFGETSARPPNEHDDRTYRPAALSFHPADEAAKHRLFARPCNDLRMLLTHRNAARRWLRGGKRSPFFASAVKTLLALSGMHAYRHKKGEHVLLESRAWIEACTAETFVNTTFRAGIACVGDGLTGDKATTSQSSSETTLEDVETLADARDALLDACVDWHDRLVWAMRRSESSVDAEGATARLADLHASPVSMHIPAHRLWAVAAHYAAAASVSVTPPGSHATRHTHCPSFFTDATMRKNVCQQACHPLRLLAFADQVVSRVWVRNGEEIRRAAGVYASRYAAGVGRDADFGFAQMALCAFVEHVLDVSSASSSEEREEEGSDGVVDVVRFFLAAGSAGAVAPRNKNACAFPFPAPAPETLSPPFHSGVKGPGPATAAFAADDTTTPMDLGDKSASAREAPRFLPSASEEEEEEEEEETSAARTVYPDPSDLPAGSLACARSTARTLVSLTRDRAWLTCNASFESKCRREVTHQLAARSGRGVTFSALAELLPTFIAAEAADVDKTLREVAVSSVSDGANATGDANATGVSYTLRDDVWEVSETETEKKREEGFGFDAFFHRYSRSEHDAALAEATRLWVRRENAGKLANESSKNFAWSPATLLRAPKPPSDLLSFGRNLLLFTRHVCLATFARDAVCFLSERPANADLQDLGLSAMALVKTALDVSVPDTNSTFTAFSLNAYLSALFESPFHRKRDRFGNERACDGQKVPYVIERLDALADARPAAGAFWREEDSHAAVLVAECAHLLARELRNVAGLPERKKKGEGPEAATTGAYASYVSEKRGANDAPSATMTDLSAATAETNEPAPPTDAKRERARLAKERQAAVLAAMAARQKAFADGLEEESETLEEHERTRKDADEAEDAMDVDVPREGLPGEPPAFGTAGSDLAANAFPGMGDSVETPFSFSSRRLPWDPVPECVLCGDDGTSGFGERDEHGSAGTRYCWLARRQRAFAPSAGRARARRTPPNTRRERRASEEEAFSRSSSGESKNMDVDETEQGVRSLEDSVDALECVGFLPVTCGHGAHAACLDRYVRSTHKFGAETSLLETDAADPETHQRAAREVATGLCDFEFRCPLCRRVCDVVVPALAATPAQTERLKDVPDGKDTRTAPTGPDCLPVDGASSSSSSSIEAALVATANGLVRGDVNDDDDETKKTKRNEDVAEDVKDAFAAPFADPPNAGCVAVFGGSFVRCFSSSPRDSPDEGERNTSMDDDDVGSRHDSLQDSEIDSLSFETGPITDTRPNDWLKLLQTVATLYAHRRVFAETRTSFQEKTEERGIVPNSASAVSAGLWRAAIEIARRATRGFPRTDGRKGRACVVTPERIARRSLTAALSRALQPSRGAYDEKKSEEDEDPLVFFSVLAFGAQVEAQAVRRFEWDVVKRRRRRASRFGARRSNEAGRARTAAAEPPTTDADADADADADFFSLRFFPELEEDPEALVAETVDAVLAEARAELSEISEPEPGLPSRTSGPAASSPAARSPAAASGASRLVSSNETFSRAGESARNDETYSHTRESLFRGGDARFLRHHPFGFLVELLARADAFEPGVFGGFGGLKKANALARAVVFAATRRAVADAPKARTYHSRRSASVDANLGEERKRETDSVSRDETTTTTDSLVSFVKSRLERTAWQVDALLSILRGEPFSLPALLLDRTGDGKEEDVVDRLFLSLFSAPFAEVLTSAVEDEGVRFCSDSDSDFREEDEKIDSTGNVAPAFRREALPSKHEDALARFADATCERCLLKPRDPAVCLACGAVMCCADASCVGDLSVTKKGDNRDAARDERALSLFDFTKTKTKEEGKEERTETRARSRSVGGPRETRAPFFLYDFKSGKKTFSFPDSVVFEDVGACAAHASLRKCGGGSCCFLLLKSTRVLILHSGSQRACLFPSPYLDAHGEEDEHMRRGRPLFLSDARCSFLEKLWACGALEHDSRATGSSRLGGEWY
jgi:hypothetical protein